MCCKICVEEWVRKMEVGEGVVVIPLVSQLLDEIGTKFQRLPLYFWGPATQRK